MNLDTEIRKLSPSSTREVVQNLECNGSWERLMEIIPKKLDHDSYECDVTPENLPKYRSDHFRLIKNASNGSNRRCSEILLDEWGTSGRVRPTLGHLLHLVKKANLYGAVDIIAGFVNISAPERPTEGPPARVRLTFEEQTLLNRREIESNLDNMSYDSSGMLQNLNGYSGMNKHNAEAGVSKIMYAVAEVRQLNDTDNANATLNGYSTENNEEIDNQIPRISALLRDSGISESIINNRITEISNSDNNGNHSDYIPRISALIENSNYIGDSSKTEPSCNVPNLSILLNDGKCISEGNFPQSMNSTTDNNVPLLSALMHSKENNDSENQGISIATPQTSTSSAQIDSDVPLLPQFTMLLQDSTLSELSSTSNIPQLSALIGQQQATSLPQINVTLESDNSLHPGSLQHITSLPHSSTLQMPTINCSNSTNSEVPSSIALTFQNSPTNSLTSSRPQCHSPLPNLSLNTHLPHFTYQELEVATNSFDETPHDPKSAQDSGRFLGSGAFASVYLALDLQEKPTAVKKLYLNGVSVVNIEDSITRQFRNEVEVLSKYKHDNLLSICGYSCDGPTYCLLYEYISGGALSSRLEKHKEQLNWQERLKIASGTAEAAAYLHTAFSSPLIHRDIKTANILLDSTNVPKLGDFGIIKFSPNQNTTVTTTIVGTSIYMAPETFRSGDVSPRTDSYSFGVVVLELLTALPPLDQTRECRDLITYVEDNCDKDSIDPLLDLSAGIWLQNDVYVAEEMFRIANSCLEEKKKRPTMVEIRDQLRDLINRVNI